MNNTKFLKYRKRIFLMFKRLNRDNESCRVYGVQEILDLFEISFLNKITKSELLKILLTFDENDYLKLNLFIEYEDTEETFIFRKIIEKEPNINLKKIKEKIVDNIYEQFSHDLNLYQVEVFKKFIIDGFSDKMIKENTIFKTRDEFLEKIDIHLRGVTRCLSYDEVLNFIIKFTDFNNQGEVVMKICQEGNNMDSLEELTSKLDQMDSKIDKFEEKMKNYTI